MKDLRRYAELVAGVERKVPCVEESVPSLEELFTGAEYFDVSQATPTQRALCRACDGVPLGEMSLHPEVARAFSSWTDAVLVPDLSDLPRPRTCCVVGAERAGKTRFAGALAVRLSQTADLSDLKPGEVPRIPIVSTTVEQARAAFDQIHATMMAKPKLRRLVMADPTTREIRVRHPSGREVLITISAGSYAGSALVSRWLIAVIFDEAARMDGSNDGAVVNLDHQLVAIRNRVRGMVLLITSPWAPSGPVFDMVKEGHGRPSDQLLVMRATGPMLNPSHWTPERLEELRTSTNLVDQIAYQTGALAEFANVDSGLLDSPTVTACMRREPAELPPMPGYHYVAAIDPATRTNSWTLVLRTRARSDRTPGVQAPPGREALSLSHLSSRGPEKPAPVIVGKPKDIIVLARQWTPTRAEPLEPEVIFQEIRAILAPYGLTTLYSDGWRYDDMRLCARRLGLSLVYLDVDSSPLYLDLAQRICSGEVELPPMDQMRLDLLALRKRLSRDEVQAYLPPPDANGRHWDYVPAIARALKPPCEEAVPMYSAPAYEREERQQIEHEERTARGNASEWWKEPPPEWRGKPRTLQALATARRTRHTGPRSPYG